MKFDLFTNAPEITMKLGPAGETVTFQTRFLTASERMNCLVLFARNVADCMSFVFNRIIGWTGIENPAGHAIPPTSTYQLPGAEQESSVVDIVIGRWDISEQVELFARICALNRVRHENIALMVEQFVDPATRKRIMDDVGPLVGRAKGAAEASSPSGAV